MNFVRIIFNDPFLDFERYFEFEHEEKVKVVRRGGFKSFQVKEVRRCKEPEYLGNIS